MPTLTRPLEPDLQPAHALARPWVEGPPAPRVARARQLQGLANRWARRALVAAGVAT